VDQSSEEAFAQDVLLGSGSGVRREAVLIKVSFCLLSLIVEGFRDLRIGGRGNVVTTPLTEHDYLAEYIYFILLVHLNCYTGFACSQLDVAL